MDDSGQSDLAGQALQDAVLAVLVGRKSVFRVARGLTVRQVLDRLPASRRPDTEATTAGRSAVATEQAALRAIRAALGALERDGLVKKRRKRLRFFVGTKGSRLFEVDVFRAGAAAPIGRRTKRG